MEQVENQPDEPKVTPPRKATPPAALFLPPVIPTQAEPTADTAAEQERDAADEVPVRARKAAAKRNPDFTPPVMPPTPIIERPTPVGENPAPLGEKPSSAAEERMEPARQPEQLPIEIPDRAPASKPRAAKKVAAAKKAAVAKKAAPAPRTETAKPIKTTAPKTTAKTEPLPAALPVAVRPLQPNDLGRTRTQAAEITGAGLWAAVQAEPRRAPAAVALAAVAQLSRGAQKQADWLRSTYPNIDTERLAKIAHRNAAGRIRIAVIASIPFAGVAGLPVYAWTQARLILELAAIYGHDAADPRRAAELLVLLGVYEDLYDADAAIDAVLDSARDVPLVPRLAVGVVPHMIRRFAGKILPGAGLVIDGLASATATEELATRAGRFYRDRGRVERV
jgi:hypothetical protein